MLRDVFRLGGRHHATVGTKLGMALGTAIRHDAGKPSPGVEHLQGIRGGAAVNERIQAFVVGDNLPDTIAPEMLQRAAQRRPVLFGGNRSSFMDHRSQMVGRQGNPTE